MKVVFSSIDFTRTVSFQRLTQYNFETTITETAIMLTGSRDQYPTLTAQIRTLAIIAKRLEELIEKKQTKALDANAIMATLNAVGRGMSALAEAFTMWVAQSRTKLLEGWIPKEVATAAVSDLLRSVDGKLLSDKEVYDVILHAIPGAGPERSERETLFIANSLVKSARIFANTTEVGPLATMARLALTNLLAWLRHALKEKVDSMQALAKGTSVEMLDARIATLRSMAGYVLGIPVSASYQVSKHYLRWLTDGWTKSVAYGTVADNLTRLVRTFEERTPPAGPFTPLSSLTHSDVYDRDIIELPTFEAELRGDPMVNWPEIDDTNQQPLAGDLHHPLAFTPEALTNWINSAWILVQYAQEAATLYFRAGYEGLSSINTPDRFPTLRGEGGIAGVSIAPGYPLISECDPSVNWPTSVWALRVIGGSPQLMHTRQALMGAMKRKHEHIPVRVVGAQPATPLQLFPIIRPVFHDLDDAVMMMDPSLESITRAWNRTPERFERLLATLGDEPNDLSWRQIAEALRFIGILTINGRDVEPFAKHWYHGRSFDTSVFGADVVLYNNSTTDVDKQTVGIRVVLRPFKTVPLSAHMDEVPTHMMAVTTEQDNSVLPILQWISDETGIKGSSVRIRGWMLGEDVIDVVLINVFPEVGDYFLTSFRDVGPFSGRKLNAVLALWEPVAAALPPTVSPAPGSFEYLG